jgi:hypothetical protein
VQWLSCASEGARRRTSVRRLWLTTKLDDGWVEIIFVTAIISIAKFKAG